jgi:hypothetical protein
MAGFSWGRVPEALAHELVQELALDASATPVEALGGTFGDTPAADFVRVAWPVLLNRWLTADADARTDVVAGLRAAGLGDHETAPRTKAAQLAYLRTCRNTARLRQTVLDRFLEVGMGTEREEAVVMVGGPVRAGANAAPQPVGSAAGIDAAGPDVARPDLRAKVESAWADLGKALAEALPALPLDAHLVLTLDPTAGGTGDATYYVEFAAMGDEVPGDELHAEAVGNAYLPAAHRLDRSAIADLVALGWSPPGVVAGTAGNFGLRAPRNDAARLAAIAVRTLREVYGAPHPAFLTTAVHALEGDVPLPALGAARPEPTGEAARVAGSAPGPDASLEERVRAVVGEITKTAPDELPVDAQGEIGIRSGSAMVFVKVTHDPLMVDVYSPILTHVRPTERLYERLSALTRSIPMGRLYLADDTVWASLPVFGRDFQASHLSLAFRVMTGLADRLDDRLQGDFGGHVFFGDALPERRETAAEERDQERTGMYL